MADRIAMSARQRHRARAPSPPLLLLDHHAAPPHPRNRRASPLRSPHHLALPLISLRRRRRRGALHPNPTHPLPITRSRPLLARTRARPAARTTHARRPLLRPQLRDTGTLDIRLEPRARPEGRESTTRARRARFQTMRQRVIRASTTAATEQPGQLQISAVAAGEPGREDGGRRRCVGGRGAT